ncbi:MAG: metal ABC transporter permease [Spirochaetes bacterium]|jgi:zinc/manganese transport system permease protein|nr:metal ABC transporter permease [Spirochaetota bacterium]
MIEIMLPAFLLSVVLLGIHSYYGLEIIRRGIIFTDLAIGQAAALGAAASLVFFPGVPLYPMSLFLALSCGALIAFASRRMPHLEAFIGLLYAAGIAGVFLVLSRHPHGMENFQNLMASDIIFTPMDEILKAAGLYAIIGLVLILLYPRIRGVFRDFIFFCTFALTVTSSVRLAGVLVVFALLVSPAVISLGLSLGRPLISAWVIGVVINVLSLLISYWLDLPAGYVLVFFHSVFALCISIVRGLLKTDSGNSAVL